MSAIPADVDADTGPPLSLPLQHFVVALGFLLASAAPLLASRTGVAGRPGPATLHLLLAGWVCVTIMGAMTQFVPVWSGVTLHSRRLSRVALWLVAPGIAALATGLATGRFGLALAGGSLALLGFWTFVYAIGRTLLRARPWDVTEAHFALALLAFLAATGLGLTLATNVRFGTLPPWLDHGAVRGAHLTLAVFGAVLLTVAGALYQLATMFTATELDRLDRGLQAAESLALPFGVVTLATGRLLEIAPIALVGGALVLVGVGAVVLVLVRRLHEASVAFTPMHRRYVVAALALSGWLLLTAPSWLRGDGALAAPLGPVPELLVAGVAFVVLGTLYHVIPFVVWFHRYSDRIGLEDVPMVDDLYDDHLAAVDGGLLVVGTSAIVLGTTAGIAPLRTAGGSLALGGTLTFVANVLLLVREHNPGGLGGLVTDATGSDGQVDAAGD